MSIENNKENQSDPDSIEKRKEAIILEINRISPKENGLSYVSILYSFHLIYINDK